MNCLDVYTDGSYSYATKNGGWGYVIVAPPSVKKLQYARYAGELNTTNNRMELMAVIKAYKFILENYKIKQQISLYTDSRYVCDALEFKWVDLWRFRNWKTSSGEVAKNQDLWVELTSLVKQLEEKGNTLRYIWVKGHNGNYFNEYVDKLAVIARKNPEIYAETFNRQRSRLN